MSQDSQGRSTPPAVKKESDPPGAAPHEEHGHGEHRSTGQLLGLCLGALGVVYGDIGTSPLYALRECFGGSHHPMTADAGNVMGIVSLIFWALTIIVSVKYLVYIMRADNRGEGGILALMALVGTARAARKAEGATPAERSDQKQWLLVMFGLFGAALLYGDGVITPAISVLSAVEGLEVAAPALHAVVIPVTIVILVGLFLIQRRGTAQVGRIFGPVMLAWFATLALVGINAITQAPEILGALSPHHAVRFFQTHGLQGYWVLGGAFLAVTGGEALYADMGHFGRRPIRLTWVALALPAIVLNYLGQGATLLADPSKVESPFFRSAPEWALLPLVALSTAATVIASQALISASFSLTRQAVQLGYWPRVKITHTSSHEIGQIYVPSINWALMVGCVALVLGFKNSSSLAAAYGIAVTATMAITTLLFFFALRARWHWPMWRALLLCGLFLAVDLAFFGANAVKVLDGGWVPLALGAVVYLLMTTWKRGREQLGMRLRELAIPLDSFLEDLLRAPPVRVPGTAVFMSGNRDGVPPSLMHNLKHNKVLHDRVVLLTLTSEEIPVVAERDRMKLETLAPGVWRLVASYGFMETPHVPKLLDAAARRFKAFDYKMMSTTFFLGREVLVSRGQDGQGPWWTRIFRAMSVNAYSATSFFGLPPNRVIELGAQIEL